MKILFISLLLLIGMVGYGQKFVYNMPSGKINGGNRYFEVMYWGLDTIGHERFGTYFFSTYDNYFPDRLQVDSMIRKDHKLPFRKFDSNFAWIISEFKNEQEYLKLNRK